MVGVRRGVFTCVGWQVTLCDPIWQVTSRSSDMGFPGRAISAFTFTYCISFGTVFKFARMSTAAVAAHPNKTAPLLSACGTDGRLAWLVQGLTYVNSQATQGLEAPPRTSASHLALDPGSRPSAAQSWPELSMVTRPGQGTLEAACGNGYAAVRGTPVMMMIKLLDLTWLGY